jgi:amino acid permease
MSTSPATSYGTIKPTRRAPSLRGLPDEGSVAEALPSPSHDGQGTLHRGLSSRQVQMIAIGGTIGTGLFLGTGRSLAQGGPASMLICYSIVGFIVYVTLILLGEMATQYPVAGECLGTFLLCFQRSGLVYQSDSTTRKWSLLRIVAFSNLGAYFGYMLRVDIAFPPAFWSSLSLTSFTF